MLTLSLLLSAVAGVNAILGGEVFAVKIAEGEYLCADDCAYDGAYFGQTGFYCPLEEAIVRVTPDGTDDKWFRYQCTGASLPAGFTERPRRDGEEPTKCYTVEGESYCDSYRDSSSSATKTIEWSEVAKQLKEAKPQNGQASPEKSSPEKPVNCAAEGSNVLHKCLNEPNPSFDKCNQQGIEAIEKCRQQ